MSRARRMHDKTNLSSPRDCPERRNELRALLTAENFMALEARCIREFGLPAGVLVRQLVYWEGKGHDPDGWIYKTKAELREEIGLSSGMVDTARRRLEDRGVLHTDRRPKRRPGGRVKHPSPVIHYRLDLLKLAQVLGYLDDDTTLRHGSKQHESACLESYSKCEESTPLNHADSHVSTTQNGTFHTHRESPKTQPESSPLQGGDGPSNRPHLLKNRCDSSPREERFENDTRPYGASPRREAVREVEALTIGVPALPLRVSSLSPQLEAETKNRAWWILTGGEGENDVTRSADQYLEGGAEVNGEPLTVERVAGKAQEHIGGDEAAGGVRAVGQALSRTHARGARGD